MKAYQLIVIVVFALGCGTSNISQLAREKAVEDSFSDYQANQAAEEFRSEGNVDEATYNFPDPYLICVDETHDTELCSAQFRTSGNSISIVEALYFVGSIKTVRMNYAYCDYRPDVDGSPTFCNDNPYPEHNFTLVVWGQNWSDLNRQCLLVTGSITTFDGKAEIVATSRSQVAYC